MAATHQMPCIPGICMNKTLEYLEVSLRLRSFEALGIFALAFPESSVNPWEVYFPGGLEQKGLTRKTKSVPLGYDT